jgi:chemotaxis protein MotB
MTSYADMVTVLFALFVMLYAMSDIDEDRFQEFAQAAAIGTPTAPGIFDFAGEGINDLVGNGILQLPEFDMSIFEFIPTTEGHAQDANQMEVMADILQTYFGDAGLSETVIVEFDPDQGMILIATHGDVYFDSGRDTIRQETFPILEVIGSAIGGLSGVNVSVEGHTDDVPIGTAQFPDNWALSTARATNILRHFVYQLQVIEPDRIQAVGHGEYRPLQSNATAEGRQANRRVEIFIFEGNND